MSYKYLTLSCWKDIIGFKKQNHYIYQNYVLILKHCTPNAIPTMANIHLYCMQSHTS